MKKTYIEFAYPTDFVERFASTEVDSREITELEIEIPKRAYAFRFFDQTEETINGKLVRYAPKNFSCWYYLGKEYSLEEVKREFPELPILAENIKSSGTNRAVLGRYNEWHILWDDDQAVAL